MLLTFYGGEPLLNMPVVRSVARSLKSFTERVQAQFRFNLSTNGSLLTRAVIEELKPLGLNTAKITLDGPSAVHDRQRPFRTGAGTFDVLLERIESAVDLTRVIIEVNFNEENTARIPELLDVLVARALHRKIFRIIFVPISATAEDAKRGAAAPELACPSIPRDAGDTIVRLQAIAVDKGFPVDTGVVAHACEMLSKRSNFIVDPEGRLYRCGALVGRPEFSFGTIDRPDDDPWLGREIWRRCMGCSMAPLCGDGCPFGSLITWGDPERLVCDKEVMERIVRESLKITYSRKNGNPPR
jgi:uncharacterized protein